MRNGTSGVGRILSACLCALFFVGVATAAGAEIYAWRTEDGSYAYTDDPDQIPARYRKQATAQKPASLESYKRYTRQDDAASARYADRLERRLQALRDANVDRPALARRESNGPGKLLVSAGDGSAIEVPTDEAGGPVVIDPGLTKRDGDMRTRRVTVVRQGDKTLAVIKGNPHNFDPIDSIQDEAALYHGVLDSE